MSITASFDEMLEAINLMPDDQQADLIEVVRHRLAARRREQILADAHEAEAEHAQGRTKVATVDEIMRGITE